MRISKLSQRQMRIGGSIFIALLMVAAGYTLPGFAFPHTQTVDAALTDEILADYVAKDTDNDGLPDWQEVLYGTDANKTDTDGDGITDGEAVRRGMLTPTSLASQLPEDTSSLASAGPETIPGITDADSGSITDQFARAFFQAYVGASNGLPMSEETQQKLVTELLADFIRRASERLESKFTIVSVRTASVADESGYLLAIERVFKPDTLSAEHANPMLLMQQLIEGGDEEARRKLSELADAQDTAAKELLAMSVPPQYREDHLLLIRSFDTSSRATRMIASYEKDPVGTMGALSVYQPASQGVIDSMQNMAAKILQTREPLVGEPGYFLVNAARVLQRQSL